MQSICEGAGRVSSLVSRQLTLIPRRHARKPSWLGWAKSKLFRVPKPLDWTPAEHQERFLIQRHHDTYMNSLWAFQEKAYKLSLEESAAHAKQISEESEIGKIMEEIERDNAIARERREKALVLEWKAVEENIVMKRTMYEEQERQRQEETKKEMEFQMERLKSCIRLEDLDAKIEEALSSPPKDFNFAIDKTGQLYYGRNNSTNVFNPEAEPKDNNMTLASN